MYTTAAYAEMLGLTHEAVRRHCYTGALECYKIAGPGHGCYIIPEGAVLNVRPVGRPKGPSGGRGV